jgi:hypothetical protein
MADMDVDVEVPVPATSKKDDSKKRFEVKKVCTNLYVLWIKRPTHQSAVECGSFMGLG